ncbi:MAG: Amuc_1102 family pilus-like protein [Verrucomicrobiae bacterium]|nr:Amuc_1102 family pilus-like protein [Verrucomicrobiae bacterium]
MIPLFAALISANTLQAQNAGNDFLIRRVEIDSLPNPAGPAIQGANSDPSIGRNWVKVLVQFDSQPARDAKVINEEKFTPEVEVKYYVGIESPTKKADGKKGLECYDMLTGGQTLIDVFDGQGHNSMAFLHPNVVRRYGGESRFTSKQTCFVFVEILVGGIVKDSFCNDKKMMSDLSWKNQIAPVTGLILNKNQTPWQPAAWDALNMIKPVQ